MKKNKKARSKSQIKRLLESAHHEEHEGELWTCPQCSMKTHQNKCPVCGISRTRK